MNVWAVDHTHDGSAVSWVDGAQDSDFPLQNLPFGVFEAPGQSARVGVAIGDRVVDVAAVRELGLLTSQSTSVASHADESSLNSIMALGRSPLRAFRHRMFELLHRENDELRAHPQALVAASDVTMKLPAEIGDYTDFYASVHHATNVGSMFRPDNPLLPNYKWIPVGYHGRASSVVVSGTDVVRPRGQTMAEGADAPTVGPSRTLDYELEVGAFVGVGNAAGEPVSLSDAESHLFGICLVNDWSARDLQKWEYVPLGPFLAKSFATTASPWVVTMDALAPHRVPAFVRPEGDPAPLPYLLGDDNQARGGINLQLGVGLRTASMREAGEDPVPLSAGSFTQMYWTFAQMLTHHAGNGCNLRPGDLLASGTVSGPSKESRGSMLELSWRGTEPITLPNGEERKFLQDGDEVILSGYCETENYVRIGLGECRGIVRPSPA